MIVALLPLEKEYCDQLERQTGEKILTFKNAKEALDKLPEAEIIISWGNFSGETLRICKSLKWLYIMSAGVEKIPFDELVERNVVVSNVSGIHGSQMAEQTLGMMIAFNRQLHISMRNQIQKKWGNFPLMDELTGKTLCIIGAGSIGKEIARKAKAFDMKVIGLKKQIESIENFDVIFGMDKLHEVLGQADYVVLLTPLTDETYHLIGQEEFMAMKRSSIFINMSRGDTVDESALIESLREGYIGGAGLDVFHLEPLPSDSPFWEMENVIITPHNGGQSPYYIGRAMDIFVKSLSLYRQEKPILNQIDLKSKY